MYFAGATATLHTHLAEHTLDLLSRITPGSSLVGGSVLCLGGTVGAEITGYPLVIVPVDGNDPIGEVRLQKAIPLPSGRIQYLPGKERLIPVMFRGLIDASQSDGGRIVKWSASSDDTPPGIVSSDPLDDTTGVSRSAVIDLEFTEWVGPVAAENFILLDQSNGQVVNCTLGVNEVSESEFHVTMTPEGLLECMAVHRIIVAGVADASGNTMSIDVRKFTTGSTS